VQERPGAFWEGWAEIEERGNERWRDKFLSVMRIPSSTSPFPFHSPHPGVGEAWNPWVERAAEIEECEVVVKLGKTHER